MPPLTHARRRRWGALEPRREHVGPHGIAQRFEQRMIARAKAADVADALGEGTHNEIRFRLEACFIGKATSMGPEHAEGMGLVHKKLEIVFLLQFHEILQGRA